MDIQEETSLKRDLVFLILQFLDEEKIYGKTARELEKESGYFFNQRYFEECITNGKWDDAEKYLSGYTKLEDNFFSRNIFFRIRRRKYLEALEKGDLIGAGEILMEELKVFSANDEDVFEETAALLLTWGDRRDTGQPSILARETMYAYLRELVEGNPLLCDKLQFPTLQNSMLRTLFDQSLRMAHQTPLLFIQPSHPSAAPAPGAASLDTLGTSSCTLLDAEPRVTGEMERSKIRKLTEMNEPSQFRCLRLPDLFTPISVVRMKYLNSGCAILALTANGEHKGWKWKKNDFNPTRKATSALAPQLWKPSSGILMINVIQNTENAVPCFALFKDDSYLLSASGGEISFFGLKKFETIVRFRAPPPAATSLALDPQDNNVVAVGMDDSSILIYNLQDKKVNFKLRGHRKIVTGLAFSDVLEVLVSSGSDAQLCLWSMHTWQKRASIFLNTPDTRLFVYTERIKQTHVHFLRDKKHVLAVHPTLLAIYKAPNLEILKQWDCIESRGMIKHAVLSCDTKSIYACFGDRSVGIFTTKTLQFRCRINPAAHLPGNRVFPVQLAAHPSEPDQFAVALSNGRVHLMEPPVEGKWGKMFLK